MAASVPPVIYSIPVSSPLHYVTYVQVYSATPQYVVVGYTPGYLGTVVSPGGVVVYGTGYTYASYVGATIWYPPPITYGYAANPYWTPWTGWAMGFGMGMAFGAAIAGSSSCCWGYCPAPYWGAMPYYPRTPTTAPTAARTGARTARPRCGDQEAGPPPPGMSTINGEPPARSRAPPADTTRGPATRGARRSATPTTP